MIRLSQTYFLCQSLCVALALCFFKVPTLYVFLYLCAQFVSATVSLLLSAPHQPRPLAPSLSLLLPLLLSPVYFYISYVALLIHNLTRAASSCLSASQKLLSPKMSPGRLLQQLQAGDSSIIRPTVTVAASSRLTYKIYWTT